MTPTAYLLALHRAGIAEGLPAVWIDREAAALLRVDERTVRRWRLGETSIPGPVEVALECLGRARAAASEAGSSGSKPPPSGASR